jgi:hypothetical protein
VEEVFGDAERVGDTFGEELPGCFGLGPLQGPGFSRVVKIREADPLKVCRDGLEDEVFLPGAQVGSVVGGKIPFQAGEEYLIGLIGPHFEHVRGPLVRRGTAYIKLLPLAIGIMDGYLNAVVLDKA